MTFYVILIMRIERDNVWGSCKYETQNRFTHFMNGVAC